MRRTIFVIVLFGPLSYAVASADVGVPAGSAAPAVSSAAPAASNASATAANNLSAWAAGVAAGGPIDVTAGTDMIGAMAKALKDKAEEVRTLNEMYKLLATQRQAVVQQITAKREELARLRTADTDAARKAIGRLEADIATLEANVAALGAKLDALRDRMEKLLAEIAELEAALERAETALQKRMERATKDEKDRSGPLLDLTRRTKTDARAARTAIILPPILQKRLQPLPVSSAKALK